MSTARVNPEGNFEIEILGDLYVFRPLTWLEEQTIDSSTEKLTKQRRTLINSLMKVGDILVASKDAFDVIEAVPTAIANRIYILYQGSLAEFRKPFKTMNIYSAPDVVKMLERVDLEDKDAEEFMDEVFGDAEEMSTNQAIYKNSGLKGATRLK